MTSSFPETKPGRLAWPPLAAAGCLAAVLFTSPCRRALMTIRYWPRSTVPKSAPATARREENSAQPGPDGPGDQEGQRAGVLIDMKIVAKAARTRRSRTTRTSKAAGVHPQPPFDGQPAGVEGRPRRQGHEEGL